MFNTTIIKVYEDIIYIHDYVLLCDIPQNQIPNPTWMSKPQKNRITKP